MCTGHEHEHDKCKVKGKNNGKPHTRAHAQTQIALVGTHFGSQSILRLLAHTRTRTCRMSHVSTLPSLKPAAASAPSSCTDRHRMPGTPPSAPATADAASPSTDDACGDEADGGSGTKLRLLAGFLGRRRSHRYAAATAVSLPPPLPVAACPHTTLPCVRPESSASLLRYRGNRHDTALPRPVWVLTNFARTHMVTGCKRRCGKRNKHNSSSFVSAGVGGVPRTALRSHADALHLFSPPACLCCKHHTVTATDPQQPPQHPWPPQLLFHQLMCQPPAHLTAPSWCCLPPGPLSTQPGGVHCQRRHAARHATTAAQDALHLMLLRLLTQRQRVRGFALTLPVASCHLTDPAPVRITQTADRQPHLVR